MTSSSLREGGAALEAKGLSIGYADHAVVEEIDLVLRRGESLALIGSNGSGKSTLLKTIAALLPPLSGDLRVLGAAPGSSPARVAYLGQAHLSNSVLPIRSIDVVRMARFASLGLFRRSTREDERIVEQAMETMRVTELRNEPLSALSGGQRQRVLIAQALARGADLLLLDEPGSGLDGASRETYRGAIRDAKEAGCSAVIATHHVEEALECDDAMLLARRVVAYGKGREILSGPTLSSTFGMSIGHCLCEKDLELDPSRGPRDAPTPRA